MEPVSHRRCAAGASRICLTVHLSTVGDACNVDKTFVIINRIDDSVITDSNSITVSSFQLERSLRARINF
jgi:hypothetical protein